MSANDKMIAKIRALLSKTEENGCTSEEAESAFSKAQDLMARYAIEDAQVAAAGGHSEGILKHVVHIVQRDEIRSSKLSLIQHIAEANHCRVVNSPTRGEVWIIGHESAAFFVEILATSVLMQYATQRTPAWAKYQAETPEWAQVSRFKWVNSFAFGYAERIGERLVADARATEEKVRTSKKAGTATTGLVLVARDAAVESWVADNLSTVAGRRRRVSIDIKAASQGEAAANFADLSGGRGHVQETGAAGVIA